jgi:acyl-CoA thioesterase-1
MASLFGTCLLQSPGNKRPPGAAEDLREIEPGVAIWPADRRVFVCLGDSLTRLNAIAKERHYPSLIEEKLHETGSALAWNWRVVNAGVQGNTSTQGLERFKKMLALNSRPPDILLVQLGANDFIQSHPMAELEKNLEAIVALARENNPKTKIILGGMIVPGSIQFMIQQFRGQFEGLCRKNAQKLPDLSAENFGRLSRAYQNVAARHPDIALITYFLEGISGHPSRSHSDWLHANEEGQRYLADRILPLFRQAARAFETRKSIANPGDVWGRNGQQIQALSELVRTGR